jgi:asparagine synthase (glutamine-hydrolysing)
MCGITGAVWRTQAAAVSDTTLHAMTDAIAHRGPDDRTFWRDDAHVDAYGRPMGAALGFRRLSIIDLAGAAQPLHNETGSVQVIFNGEIYNFESLRRRLEGSGHRFSTHGDGEPIAHLYEDIGTDVFGELNGMFAIAIWDARRHRLVLARDRIGQKPLYYAATEDRIVFGSELKCFAAVEGVLKDIDPAAIDEFLTYQYIPHPGTIWKGVRKVPPGHYVVYENGKATVHRYWKFDPSIERPIDHATAVSNVRELLTDSVRLRLQADVPLGTFLSGGIDSSIITAIAQKLSPEPVQTFSIGFPIADFDETHYAAEVAKHLGTRHTRLEVQPDAVEIIDQLAWFYDEPFGDSSAVPTFYLSKLTRENVTVALSGDGGDELFAGYDRYRALWMSQLMQRYFPVHRIPGVSLMQRLPDSNRRQSIVRKAKRFFEAAGQPAARRYLNWLQIFPESLRASLYRDEFVETLPGNDPFEFLESVWAQSAGRDVVTRASTADILSYLPCDLCTKVDIASMSNALEVRQPMLDYRLVELAASLPVSMKFRGRKGKLILQAAFGDLIPASIFKRTKMGFGIPIANWFRNELKPMVHETLLGDDSRLQTYFRREVIQSLVTAHENGSQNHGYRLWNLLMLEKWLRRWVR